MANCKISTNITSNEPTHTKTKHKRTKLNSKQCNNNNNNNNKVRHIIVVIITLYIIIVVNLPLLEVSVRNISVSSYATT